MFLYTQLLYIVKYSVIFWPSHHSHLPSWEARKGSCTFGCSWPEVTCHRRQSVYNKSSFLWDNQAFSFFLHPSIQIVTHHFFSDSETQSLFLPFSLKHPLRKKPSEHFYTDKKITDRLGVLYLSGVSALMDKDLGKRLIFQLWNLSLNHLGEWDFKEIKAS